MHKIFLWILTNYLIFLFFFFKIRLWSEELLLYSEIWKQKKKKTQQKSAERKRGWITKIIHPLSFLTEYFHKFKCIHSQFGVSRTWISFTRRKVSQTDKSSIIFYFCFPFGVKTISFCICKPTINHNPWISHLSQTKLRFGAFSILVIPAADSPRQFKVSLFSLSSNSKLGLGSEYY